MREACALRHLSLSTEKTYTHWLLRYAAFLKDPKLKSLTTELKIETFLTNLALSGVSASTENQAFNGLLFFYRSGIKQELGPLNSLRAKRHETLRPCPDRQDVLQLLASVSDIYSYPTRLIVHLLYACGLRVSEPLNLRIKDIDLTQRRLYVHQAKGNKGRVVLFPDCLAPALQRQLEVAKAHANQDEARRKALPRIVCATRTRPTLCKAAPSCATCRLCSAGHWAVYLARLARVVLLIR